MKVSCAACGRSFDAERKTAKYCGPTCRKRKQRRGASVDALPAPPQPIAQSLADAVRADLELAGRLDTALGRQAVQLAERMASPFDTGSAIAALSRELRAVMSEALKDSSTAADPLDELAQRRALKAASA
jgi:hypothetical protein